MRWKKATGKKRVVLTARDMDILTFTGLCGYISSEQVAREWFKSRDRARHRLRDLFQAGLVDLSIVCSTRPNLVSLTRLGTKTVAKVRPSVKARLKTTRAIPVAGLEHHLAIVDARFFAAALRLRTGWCLAAWGGGQGELASELGLPQFRLRPDAAFVLTNHTRTCICCLEVDCGTEGTPVLDSKIERYGDLLGHGGIQELWVVVTAGVGRQETLKKLIAKGGLGRWTRFLTPSSINARPVAGFPRKLGGRGV
jgi:hypothetical protein